MDILTDPKDPEIYIMSFLVLLHILPLVSRSDWVFAETML